MNGQEVLFHVEDLTKVFLVNTGFMKKKASLTAVSHFNLDIMSGETLGVVGESGCGKSTTGRLLLKLMNPTSGQIVYRGKDITMLTEKEMKPYRKEMQFIFQDPYASLNPRYKIIDAIAEPMEIFHILNGKKDKEETVGDLLESVGLTRESLYKYPHEFSGGQRQRICIARALAVNPGFIVADEPVSALDVSVQAQIINLMTEKKKQYGFTYMFISHDMGVVRYVCDRIVVMYLGHIVEIARKKELFTNPVHPYTRALLNAVPEIGKKGRQLAVFGEVPSPINPPSGCVFHPRCPYATDRCRTEAPPLCEENGHSVACWDHMSANNANLNKE